MAYFLKKTKTKKGLYLQIYDSYRDPVDQKPRSRSVRAIGYLDDLVSEGIEDPIADVQKEIDEHNEKSRQKMKAARKKKIAKRTPLKNLGYFLAEGLLQSLNLRNELENLIPQKTADFSHSACLCWLAAAALYGPLFAREPAAEAIARFYRAPEYSTDQILTCLHTCGRPFEQIAKMAVKQTQAVFGYRPEAAYFDRLPLTEVFDVSQPADERLWMTLLIDADLLPAAIRICGENVLVDTVFARCKEDFLKATGKPDPDAATVDTCRNPLNPTVQDGFVRPFNWLESFLDETESDAVQCLFEDTLIGFSMKAAKEKQTLDAVQGCLLVCFLAVLLRRLLLTRVFENRFSWKTIEAFMTGFLILPGEDPQSDSRNMSVDSDLARWMEEKYELPVRNSRLSRIQIEKILGCALI